MISRENIVRYLVKQVIQLDYQFNLAIRTMDDEAIHQFRVATKRVRSVSSYIHDITGVRLPSNKIIHPLKKLFRPAGELRDFQVQSGIIDKVNEDMRLQLTVIPAYYRKKESVLKYRFAAHGDSYDETIQYLIPEQAKQNLALHPDEQLDRLSREWMEERFRSFRDSSQIFMDEEKLHLFRKLFKQAFYIIEVFQEPSQGEFLSKDQFEMFKKFGQELGNWHDYYLILGNLENFRNMHRPLRIREESICLREHIQPVYNQILDKVLQEIRSGELFETILDSPSN